MELITNAAMWNALRTKFPQFKSITSKATDDFFTERGWTALSRDGAQGKDALNKFFGLSLRVYLDRVNVGSVKDKLAAAGFGEDIQNTYGGFIQRMAVDSINAVDPAWLNLENGTSPDPFIVRKPTTRERFFVQNFNFQTLVSITAKDLYRDAFINETGMQSLMDGILTRLNQAYIKQVYVAKLEALNAGINSTKNPLQPSQIVEVTGYDQTKKPTEEMLVNLVLSIKKIMSLLDAAPSSTAFNQYHFDTAQDMSDLRLLVRPGFKAELDAILMANSYHDDRLNVDLPIIEVNNFGGLLPFKDKELKTSLDVHHDALGSVDGYTDPAAPTVIIPESNIFWKDPNEDIIGLIADRHILLNARQANYSVEEIYNPRGLYTNYWASMPNGTISYDFLYNLVALKVPLAA